MQEIIMIWFLLCTLWTVAFIFNIWLLPEILIYAMAKFAYTYFGGGLVAQWRCRVGNRDSERLAARLGFVSRGRQTAVALG